MFIIRKFHFGPSWWWSYSIWIYNYLCNQWLSPPALWVWIPIRWGVLDTILCGKVCQWLVTGQWFSLGTPVSFTNKTDRHDINWNIVESDIKHDNPISKACFTVIIKCFKKWRLPVFNWYYINLFVMNLNLSWN